MDITLGIGSSVQTVSIPDKNLVGVLKPKPVSAPSSVEMELLRALSEPIGSKRLRKLVKPGEKIAIITSDITRPMPTGEVMPALLDELYAAGVQKEDISLVFGLGSHRPHTAAEQEKLAGTRAFREIACIDSTPDDCIHLGTTKGGTPVDISRIVAEADRRICLGNIEYHYFAGYSGGGKALMPGVSTREAIQANHRMMVLPEACAGRLEGNPLREDIEEAAAICGIDFILNVVLSEHKEILKAFAGDAVLAHRAGCSFLDTLYGISVKERADIVIVSQGGAPKDLNLYQTQKALDNAKHAVRAGGVIILVGSCREGLGEAVFEEWMLTAKKPGDLVTRIGQNFELGGHKAAAIAMVLQNADIYLVSELAPDFVERLFMKPFEQVQDALEAAMEYLGDQAKVLVMPYGGSTLPKLVHAL